MTIDYVLRHLNNQNSVDPPRSESDVIPDADASSPELLCGGCRKIDWDNLSSTSAAVLKGLGDSRHGVIVLRAFAASRAQLLASSCRICRLVGHLKDPDPRFQICRLEISRIRGCKVYRGGEMSGENKIAVRSMRSYPSTMHHSELQDVVVRNLVAHCFSLSNAPVDHREPLSIEFNRFRWMIGKCRREHQQCRSLVGEASGLRLIQVETGKIVKAEADCQYVALSYVWGKEPPSQKESNSFPLVIGDAILATKHLGFQYLWVDRYCIDQGSEHKKQMIDQMDRVYSNAFVTIVAAAGSDASAGLAGISRPRQKQYRATVGKTHLIEVWDDGHDIVKNSAWASRGWTYQESYLSPRCVIFTDREVIYLCNSAHMTETQWPGYDKIKKVPKRFRWMIPPGEKRGYWLFDERVCPQIEEYSARVLSNEDDSLNAFLGILKHYESHAENPAEAILHLWGITTRIPIPDLDGVHFDVLWRHKDVAISRRPGFPSWSWVGWSGAIEYVSNVGYNALILPPRPTKQNTPGPIEEKQPGIEDTAWNIHIYNGDQLCELSDFCRLGAQRSSQPKELLVTALVLGMRFREVGSKICATFPIRHDTFVAVPVFLDRPFDSAIHTLGFILPRGGGRTYNDSCMYNVVILQKVGEERFERAGIVDLSFSKWHGTLETRGQVVLSAQDDQIEAEVKPDDYLFLSNSEKKSFWLV